MTREIDSFKLTRAQEREALRGWPVDCPFTDEAKIDIFREQLAADRAAAADGLHNRTLESLRKRIAALERQAADWAEVVAVAMAKFFDEQMRRRCILSYQGIWLDSQTYMRGDVCTAGNSLWCAVVDHSRGQTPGKSTDWRLIARAGSAP